MAILSFLLCLLFASGFALSGQPVYQRLDTIAVVENQQTLQNPWSGGLHTPQFSAIDLNLDGVKDLFIFEKYGQFIGGYKILTFINEGIPGQESYRYAPEYASLFPPLENWALLRDYDCDGYEDIFTGTTGGIKVYRNTASTNQAVGFELAKSILTFSDPPNEINLYVSSVDIPGIVDVYGDGDLDVLTFDIFGGTLDYYENLSMENYGSCDSLEFAFVTACWGHFYETANCGVYELNDTCFQPERLDGSQQRHAGSTVTPIDIDGDNDMDLILGDVSCRNLSLLVNGNSRPAHITSVDTFFPSYDVAADVPNFPAAFILDVNNDELDDLVVAPTNVNGSASYQNVWYYRNTGTTTQPVFNYTANDFLQGEMIDLGQDAVPVFIDVDGDTLIDLLVANYRYYDQGNPAGMIAWYRNTGDQHNPEFTLITRDFNGLSSLGLRALYPAFGDLDGDGDADMMLGEESGSIHFFENTSASSTMQLTLTQAFYGGIDVGQFSAPNLADLDKDGDLDLIIGNKNGSLYYYENTGGPSSPQFTFITDTLGGVDVRPTGWITGYSKPFVTTLDSTGKLYLFCGSEPGKVYLYENIENNLQGVFKPIDTILALVYEGGRSAVALADLNNNGRKELAVGNFRGGVALYHLVDTIINIIPGRALSAENTPIKVYPNPAGDYLNVHTGSIKRIEVISIYDVYGRLCKRYYPDRENPIISLQINPLKPGIYLLQASTGKRIFSRKFVKY